MIKKRLSPLLKPTHLNQIPNNASLNENLAQLIKQQKVTNQMIQAHFNLLHNNQRSLDNSQVQQIFKVTPTKLINNGKQIMHNPRQKTHNQNQHFQRQDKITSLEGNHQKQSNFYYQKYTNNQSQNPFDKMQNSVENHSELPQQGSNILKNALQKKLHNQDQKKNYNVLNQFLPYTDRRQFKFLVGFADASKQFPIISGVEVLEQITIEWIGDVFRMAASMCWNMMLNGFLNYEQTKILFTQNIIYNYIQFMKELQKRNFGQFKHHLTLLMNKKSVNVLDFLGKQYPQTKIEVPNIRLKQILPNINNSARLKFDVITIANRKGFVLKYNSKGLYSSQVMELINFMIDQTNDQYQMFEKQCLHIFQQIYKLPQKRALASQGNKFINQKVTQKFQSSQDLAYKQKAKKYAKYLIGRKINKNVPKYTRQQINNGVFFPKSPSILRIITKWVQQLTQIIKKPEDFILSADRQLKSHAGNFVVLFSAVRQAVCDKIIQKRGELFRKIQEIKDECSYIESILTSSRYTQDENQTHLSEDQISVGKFSVYLQKAISSYIFLQLNQILHFLLSIPYEIDQNNIGIQEDFYRTQIRKQLDKLNLVTMKIFDLLRCKCVSNEQDIIWIMKYLIDRNRVGDFKLVRVKDRLNQGTRDINCNLRFAKTGMLCEMQLSVVSNIQSKQQKLDSYNHFLYELKRSKLGPLSQNVSIWTVLQQRSQYFQDIARNPIPSKPNFHTCSNENLQKFNKPISCQSCYNFYPYPQTCYSNVKCKKCKKTYCGDCYSKVLSQQQKKAIIFQGLFKETVTNHIKLYNDPQTPFPMQGIYLKRYHQKRQLNFFTILVKHNVTHQPLSIQSIRQITSKQNQVQCQILFTHNAIRNGKTIQKQKNAKKLIKGVFKHNKGLFINKKDFSFFNQYLIFYFDQKFEASTLTLGQIQKFLRDEQNHKLKVLNIMQDPVYVDQIQYLRKKSEKVRQLQKLSALFKNNPQTKFLVYHFKNIFIVAKVYKEPIALGQSINYDNNMAKFKQFAITQKSIISMQKSNLKHEIQNIEKEFSPKLILNLQNNLRKVYFNYNGLQSVRGLKKFIYIEVLYLRHNHLTNLEGLQDMKQLIVLRFDDNKVEGLEPLSNLIGLKRLMGIDNKIKSLQPLRNLKQLRTVQFERNELTSLQPIKDIPDLQDINFKTNPNLSQFCALASKNLKSISLSNTNIKDFSHLSKYTKVRRLMLQHLHLKQIPSLVKQMKLSQLWLGDNQIQQISNFQGQYELEILSLKKNKIKQLKNLQDLEKIKLINLDSNLLISLKGVKCCFQTLKTLSVKDNPLEDIKQLVYTDETFKFEFSRDKVSEQVTRYYEQLFISKINSSGSQD